jgi:hypothetical protein
LRVIVALKASGIPARGVVSRGGHAGVSVRLAETSGLLQRCNGTQFAEPSHRFTRQGVARRRLCPMNEEITQWTSSFGW